MTATYDVSSSVGLVRLLSIDTDITSPLHQDEEILGFLALEKGNVKRAAANALDDIANRKILTSKLVSISSLKLDITSAPKMLKEKASELRSQAEEEEACNNTFSVIPFRGEHL